MKSAFAIKTLAASVALGFASHASAVFEIPATGNGSLVFSAWDATSTIDSSRTFTQTLNVLINDFLPSQVGVGQPGDNPNPGNKTPVGGLTQSFTLDSLFGTTFAGVAPGNIRWNVFGGDSLNNAALPGTGLQRMVVTGGVAPTGSNSALNVSTQNGDTYIGTLVGSYGCGSADSCNDPAFGTLGFAGDQNTWGNRIGQALPTGNNITAAGYGTSFFYYVQQNTAGGSATPFSLTPFANAAGQATWSLDPAGTLTYSIAAVPEPSTWVMLAAGLLGLFGVARRRMTK